MTEQIQNIPTGQSPQTAADYEYNTLMRLLGVSVSKHLLDDHFTMIWGNDFYYRLIGWPKDEYEAMFHNQPDRYYRYYDDTADWDQLSATVRQALSTHQSGYDLVSRMRCRSGKHVWVQIFTAFAEEYVNGFQVAYTVMTNIDNLVRMQREQSVTYDNLPGFIAKYRIEADGFHLLDANDRFRHAFCNGSGDCPSHGLTNLSTEKNTATMRQNFPLMREGKPVHFTLQGRDASGGNLWLQVNAECIDRADGVPVYLVIYIDITDITEQRELQKQLEERSQMLHDALKAAEKANRAKSDFLSRMSHDIRTPMNAILGMKTIAASHVHNQERVLDCLDKIEVASRLLLSLINEVLDMSKIESGRIVLAQEEVNLAELVQGVVTMVLPQLSQKNLVFKSYLSGVTHEIVVSDMQRLQQLLLNLLSNAAKYTRAGGQVTLEISETPSGQPGAARYAFVVSDTGIGMKPAFLAHVFEPFERADDEEIRVIQGTGLGLSICKSIAEMMGGTIVAESKYGSGSRFTATVELPILEQTIDASALTGLRVLVADDDETICRAACERLEDFGVQPEWVTGGREAVQKVRDSLGTDREYFAVIIDYMMPGLDGLETIRQIRQLAGKALPIIMISAYDLTEKLDEAVRAGADDYITKPLFRSRLLLKLRQFLDGGVRQPKPRAVLDEQAYRGKRVLLVEDNELNREISAELLSGFGLAVDSAENGKIAVDMVARAPLGFYDLIFMDMQMPVMDGCTAAAEIRRLPRSDAAALPIVAMTANAFADDRRKTKEAGMNGHLTKPIELPALRQVLDAWMG